MLCFWLDHGTSAFGGFEFESVLKKNCVGGRVRVGTQGLARGGGRCRLLCIHDVNDK